MPPGARLPAERAICEKLAVSRSAVRGALSLLEGERVIVRVAGSGSYIAETLPGTADTDLNKITSPAQIMDARLALEPSLARLVAANGTASDMHAIRTCVESGSAAKELQEFERLDAAFHEIVADSAHNPLVQEAYRLITQARDQNEWGELKRRSLNPERRQEYQADHERILIALESRDSDAAERHIREHLLRVRASLLAW